MSEVLYAVERGLGRITINRPERGNALDTGTLQQLRRTVQLASEDSTLRVMTITGMGEKVFCAGADLNASLEIGPEGDAFGRSDYGQLLLEIAHFPRPTVALARGHVLGGGMGILLACDLSLACSDIHLSTPEIKVGMFPMMVMAFLYRRTGRARATEMMFLGERISAASALEYGLLNRVIPRDQFEAAADDYLGKLAEKSPSILRLGKEAIFSVMDRTLAADLEVLEARLVDVMTSEDSKEGILAFVEKRKPNWVTE